MTIYVRKISYEIDESGTGEMVRLNGRVFSSIVPGEIVREIGVCEGCVESATTLVVPDPESPDEIYVDECLSCLGACPEIGALEIGREVAEWDGKPLLRWVYDPRGSDLPKILTAWR